MRRVADCAQRRADGMPPSRGQFRHCKGVPQQAVCTLTVLGAGADAWNATLDRLPGQGDFDRTREAASLELAIPIRSKCHQGAAGSIGMD